MCIRPLPMYTMRRVLNGLILTGGFLSFFISFGNAQSFGVLYSEFLEYFGSSKQDTSWIASLNSGILLGLGPVVGVITEKYGCRTTSMIGAICIAVGMLSSVFIENIYVLYLTYGIIVGIGYSFTLITGTLAINIHFDKHRSLAVGIASAGTGVGSMVFPVLGTFLINQFGWRGTFLIYAGVGLQGFISGMAFGLLPKPRRHFDKQTQPTDKGFLRRTKDIFCTVQYTLFATSGVLVYMGYFVPFIMLPDMAVKSGVDESTAAFMITTSGVASIISRIIIGVISDLQCISRLVINGVGLMGLGILTSLCSFYGTDILFVYTAFLGAVTGIFGMYQSVIAVEIIGKDNMCLAVGYINLLEGIAVVVGPPLAGYISDVSDSYTIAFLYSGGLLCLGGLFSLLSYISKNCVKTKV